MSAVRSPGAGITKYRLKRDVRRYIAFRILPAMIDAFFKVIDWDAVNANLKAAQAAGDAAKAAR